MLAPSPDRPPLRLMTCGSVDDGKSTLIGRLLYDTRSLPADQLASLEAGARDGQLDFASLVDGLEAEREQGITIDVAYRHLTTPRRRFLIADTPGHEQYTRNMATAASEAEVALILVDARKGLLVQTRRHATIAALFGIRHIVLAVNKMDLVGYDQTVFEAIEDAFAALAGELGLSRVDAVPVSAAAGDNLLAQSPSMAWYDGPPLLSLIEEAGEATPEVAMRFPVQWVNRPTQDFRGLAGTLASGSIAPGDVVVNARTGETAPVASVLKLDGTNGAATAGEAVTLTLAREIDVSRGDILCPPEERPSVSDQLAADIVWMSGDPLIPGRRYLIKLAHRTVPATVTELRYVLDVETGEHLAGKTLALNEIGRCNLSLHTPLAFDAYQENRRTGAFILIDPFTRATVGAGLARFALRRADNVHWQALSVDRAARARLLHQTPKLLWFTGLSGAGKSTIADIVERKLHALGRHTYILDGDNVRHGLNRDLGFTDADRVENIRRVIEVARLMLDAGLIVIASFISPFRAERQMARDLVGAAFTEIFVSAPLGVAEARDPKGLYAKARAGKLANFTGIDSPYEAPEAPELTLDTTTTGAEELADLVVAHLLDAER